MKNYFWQFIAFLKPKRLNLAMVAGVAGMLVPLLDDGFQWYLIGIWALFSIMFALSLIKTP